MTKIDICDTQRNNLIAAALGLQQCTRTAANIVPLPGTDRFIAIGTPGDVARLVAAENKPTAPLSAEELDKLEEKFRNNKCITRAEQAALIAQARLAAQPVVAKDIKTWKDRLKDHVDCRPGEAERRAMKAEIFDLRAALAAPVAAQADTTEPSTGDFAHIERLSKATTRPYTPIYQVWNTGSGAWDDANEREYAAAPESYRRTVYVATSATATSAGDADTTEPSAGELLDAAECLLEVLDGYHEQLVPINRKSTTVTWLRKAVAAANKEHATSAGEADTTANTCNWPICQPEHVQQQVADQVYRELYSGEPTPQDRGAGMQVAQYCLVCGGNGGHRAGCAAPTDEQIRSAIPVELAGVAEEVKSGSGFWHSCSGCYDTEDGHPTMQYAYSRVLGCALGNGCSECGGIGAVWDNADYEAMARDWDEDDDASPAQSSAAPAEVSVTNYGSPVDKSVCAAAPSPAAPQQPVAQLGEQSAAARDVLASAEHDHSEGGHHD